MNVKALTLIFLVIFATAAATVFVVGLSGSRIAEENVGFTRSHNIVKIGNETLVKPNELIDTPGMPG